MKCHSAHKKFSAYQDRELNPIEQEEVSRHLLSCQSCRDQYAEFERFWKTLEEIEDIHPGPWLYQQLVERIKQPPGGGLLPVLQHIFELLRGPTFASVLLAGGILFGIYLGNVMIRSDFLPFRQTPTSYSQEAFLDTLRVFDSAPPGTLAHGYMEITGYKGDESK